MKISVVIPTNRKDYVKKFLEEWSDYFSKNETDLYIVEDNPNKEFDIDAEDFDFEINHYCWRDIDNDLGENSWIISRRSGSIRSYGILKAYQSDSDIIITLDDDCYPLSEHKDVDDYNYFQSIEHNLFERIYEEEAWDNSTSSVKVKGFPKETSRVVNHKEIVINHGLWANIPDLSGETQADIGDRLTLKDYYKEFIVPKNKYFPMCGMNLAWKSEVTPIMYFMLMGEDADGNPWGYNRFGDNWSGIFVKKICDHLNYRIYSGEPIVWHDRASRVNTNIEEEKTSMEKMNVLWQEVDKIKLKSNTFKGCYKELAQKLSLESKYFNRLKEAMIIWSSLF